MEYEKNGFGMIGKNYRVATLDEVAALAVEEGAPHVTFGCTSCGMVNWHAKNLALAANGGYSGQRSIFQLSWSKGECDCAPSFLRCVVAQ